MVNNDVIGWEEKNLNGKWSIDHISDKNNVTNIEYIRSSIRYNITNKIWSDKFKSASANPP